MADNITLNAASGTFTVSTDEASSGQVQRVKLTYSADGSDVHIPADSEGLLVNLGANNDVTVTSGAVPVDGTVTANAGTGNFGVNLTQVGGSSPGATNPIPVRLTDGTNFLSSATEAALADDTSNPTTSLYGSMAHWFDGTAWDRARGDATNGLLVNLGANNDVVIGAGTSLIGSVAGVGVTGSVYQGTTARTVQFAAVAASSSGDNEIVAAAGSGNKIRVLKWSLWFSGTVNAKWRSGTTDLTGLCYGLAGKDSSGAETERGHFETAANEALNLNLSGATAVGGYITYIVVT